MSAASLRLDFHRRESGASSPSSSPSLCALAYHKVAPIPHAARHRCNYVTPAQFDRQLRALRRAGFQSISIAQYVRHRTAGASLPARAVLITFDDGYRSNLEIAVPILRNHGFSATFFVVAALLDSTNVWDADEIQEPLLSVDDVRRLDALGFEIGSHTMTHPHLSSLSPSELLWELTESKRRLEEITSQSVTALAYPWSEHSPRVRRAAQEAGYRAGAILRRRANFGTTPLFELRRIGVNEQTSLARLIWDLGRLRFRGA